MGSATQPSRANGRLRLGFAAMSDIKLVVTDMDGTLYSWVDYIVPAVEALVASVCLTTGYPKLRVVQALKEVYGRYESNEYPYALQESALYRDFADFGSFDHLVIQPAKDAFSNARKRYLRPFPHVVETLRTLEARGIPVVALTDAPRNPAVARVKQMGLEPLLEGLYTMPGFVFPKGPDGKALVNPRIEEREASGHYQLKLPVTELTHEKPDPKGLLRICEDFRVDPSQVLVIGDSKHKDVAVARQVGARALWAEYGTYVSLEYRDRLDVISAPSVTRRHASSLNETATEDASLIAVSNFAGLLRHLGD